MGASTDPTAARTVAAPHVASYDAPISVRAGDMMRLTGRSDIWDGYRWLWASGPGGREGWIPDDLVPAEHDVVPALRDYSAAELTCAAGDRLAVIDERHGWALCRDANGAEGWVPARNLIAS